MGDAAYTSLGTATTDGSGSFSVTPSSALPEGDYSLIVTAADSANNVSTPSTSLNITVDLVNDPATFGGDISGTGDEETEQSQEH